MQQKHEGKLYNIYELQSMGSYIWIAADKHPGGKWKPVENHTDLSAEQANQICSEHNIQTITTEKVRLFEDETGRFVWSRNFGVITDIKTAIKTCVGCNKNKRTRLATYAIK